MNLNFHSFCGQYIFFPDRLKSKGDQKKALALSIISGVFLLGMLHLGALLGRTIALNRLKAKIYQRAQKWDHSFESLSPHETSLAKAVFKTNTLNPYKKTFTTLHHLTTSDDLIFQFLSKDQDLLASDHFVKALATSCHLEEIAKALWRCDFKATDVPLRLLQALYQAKKISNTEFIERFGLNDEQKFLLHQESVAAQWKFQNRVDLSANLLMEFNISQTHWFQAALTLASYPADKDDSKYFIDQLKHFNPTPEQYKKVIEGCVHHHLDLKTLHGLSFDEETLLEILKKVIDRNRSMQIIKDMQSGRISDSLICKCMTYFIETKDDWQLQDHEVTVQLEEFNKNSKKFSVELLYELNLAAAKKRLLNPLCLIDHNFPEQQLSEIIKHLILGYKGNSLLACLGELKLPESLHYFIAFHLSLRAASEPTLIQRSMAGFTLTLEQKITVIKEAVYQAPSYAISLIHQALNQEQRFMLAMELVSDKKRLNEDLELDSSKEPNCPKKSINIFGYIECFDMTDTQLLNCWIHSLAEASLAQTSFEHWDEQQRIALFKKIIQHHPGFTNFSLLKSISQEGRFELVVAMLKEKDVFRISSLTNSNDYDLTQEQLYICQLLFYFKSFHDIDLLRETYRQANFKERGRYDVFARLLTTRSAPFHCLTFFFETQEERLLLALKILPTRPSVIFYAIKDFELPPQQTDRVQLLCALLDPFLIHHYIMSEIPHLANIIDTVDDFKTFLESPEMISQSYQRVLAFDTLSKNIDALENSPISTQTMRNVFHKALQSKLPVKFWEGLHKTDPFAKDNQIQWLLTFLSLLEQQGLVIQEANPALQELIYNSLIFPDPSLRRKVSAQILLLLDCPASFAAFETLFQKVVPSSKKKKPFWIPHYLLAPLYTTHPAVASHVLNFYFLSKNWFYGPNQKVFVQFLHALTTCNQINPTWKNLHAQFGPEEQSQLLTILFGKGPLPSAQQLKKSRQPLKPALKDLSKNLQRVTDIIKMGYVHLLKEVHTIKDIEPLILKIFQEFQVEDMAIERFDATFAKFRNLDALFTYRASLEGLSADKREKALPALNSFVQEVLNATFHANRYDEKIHPHLVKVFQDRPELKQKWMTPSQHQLSLGDFVKETPINDLDYLKTKLLVDGHLGPHAEETYPYLFAALKQPATLPENRHALGPWSEDLNKEQQFQILALTLIEQSHTKDKRRELLQNLLAVCPQSEFRHDLEGLTAQRPIVQGSFLGMNTDDPCDLLLIGTEVPGSCQRVNGDPNNNCGLVGFLLNGYLQPQVLKDEQSGEIVARSILRLLIDSETDLPVLFQDRCYTRDAAYEPLIDHLCLLRAQELGLPLMKKIPFGEADLYKDNTHELLALANRAPFEYVDGAEGLQTEGYQITNVYQVNAMKEKQKDDNA